MHTSSTNYAALPRQLKKNRGSTFIDYFSRFTWPYLLKHKGDVFYVFKDLCALIQNQFRTTTKTLHSKNGTEYANPKFTISL
jgi:hypothetical protein